MRKDRRQSILEAVKAAKRSQFGVTAIKVELEAQFSRADEFRHSNFCHDWIMERLEGLGLAELGDWVELSHGAESEWNPSGPLTYAEFYNDGSVDSEFTFTIMLDDPENIFLIPKIIQVFKDLGEANGRGMDVRGAGMHMAWLNSSDGDYPTVITRSHQIRFDNFRRSMQLLVPALYFLGSPNAMSRGLSFRKPQIGHGGQKYSAISYRDGAVEFRVFDTCYEEPETVLDNVCVMSRCMRYWRASYVPSGLEAVTREYSFGTDHGERTLERFYTTYTHIDLLNRGLAKLKPAHYTIGDVKKQRQFELTKRGLNKKRKDQERQARVEYEEYKSRFEWRLKYLTFEGVVDSERGALVEAESNRLRTLQTYINDKLRNFEESGRGQYRLGV